MKKLQLLLILLTTVFTQFTTAQEKITPPSKGKAVIYFIVTNGSHENLKYFDGEKYLGKFNGRKAFRYECDPGKHIFWIKSLNIDHIESELKSGAIYLIEVRKTVFLFVKSTVKLFTVNATDKRQMKRIKKIFEKKKLINLNTYEVTNEYDEIYDTEEEVETKERIAKNLKTIALKKKRGRKIKKITPDMEYIKQ